MERAVWKRRRQARQEVGPGCRYSKGKVCFPIRGKQRERIGAVFLSRENHISVHRKIKRENGKKASIWCPVKYVY